MGFKIQTTPILPQTLQATLDDPTCGAMVQFEGRIRNHNDGRNVTELHYEAHASFAEAEGKRILEEAQSRFAIQRCQAVHRIGTLAIGDIAVWVGVSSAHRQEAFLACRWIMDEIKQRAAIWKKENYQDVEAKWVGIADAAEKSDNRYQRQTCLPGFGSEGQAKLKNAKVLVVGCGGLGCPVLQSLAAMGVGTLTLCDGDRIALDNLPRQILFGDAEIGRNKAEAAADKLRQLNPELSFRAVAQRVTSENISMLIADQDVILDCADNFSITYLLNDNCMQADLPLIQASVHQLEGQLNVFIPQGPGGCYRCLWPKAPAPGCIQNCQDAGILATTTAIVGNQQAMETIKLLLGWPDLHATRTLLTDLSSGGTRKLNRVRQTTCLTCNGVQSQTAKVEFLDSEKRKPLPNGTIKLDLREKNERDIQPSPEGWQATPRDQWEELPKTYTQTQPLLLACASSIRAQALGEWLTQQGFSKIMIWQDNISKYPKD